MTTDDSDVESSNPSKSFKVGDFDRLSGFFTPVWESKRKLRSESPIPSSSAAAAPTSSRGSAALGAPAPQPGAPSEASPAQTRSAQRDAAEPVPAAAAAPRSGATASLATARASSLGSLQPSNTSARPAAHVTLAGVASPELLAKAAAGATQNANPKEPLFESSEAGPSTPDGAHVRPMIPMPSPSPRQSARPKSSSPPSAASVALQQAGPQLNPEAYFDREPEFRQPLAAPSPAAPSPTAPSPAAPSRAAQPLVAKSPAAVPLGPVSPGPALPPRAERPKVNHRSLRASVAATAIHEKLKAKQQTDSAETLTRHREAESDREAIQAAAARAVATPAETHPVHLLRRLRRTIHLSTPLPESVRAMLSKFRG